jgi:hypothetical protein
LRYEERKTGEDGEINRERRRAREREEGGREKRKNGGSRIYSFLSSTVNKRTKTYIQGDRTSFFPCPILYLW